MLLALKATVNIRIEYDFDYLCHWDKLSGTGFGVTPLQRGISMKKSWTLKCCLALLTIMTLVQFAFAVGFWVPGKVTRAPWYDNNYRYMVVGNVKYTIMKEAVAREVIQKKDVVYKPGIDIGDIRRGDEVQVMAEGNRIYQIEILR